LKKLNKISSILLCFLLMLLFTACGSTKAKVADDKLEKTKAEIQQAETSSNEDEVSVDLAEIPGNNQTTTTVIPHNNKICHISYPNHGRFQSILSIQFSN